MKKQSRKPALGITSDISEIRRKERVQPTILTLTNGNDAHDLSLSLSLFSLSLSLFLSLFLSFLSLSPSPFPN